MENLPENFSKGLDYIKKEFKPGRIKKPTWWIAELQCPTTQEKD